MWRHKKIYKAKGDTENSREKKSQTFLASTGLLGNFLNKSRLKQEVFNVMRPAERSFTAKHDALICLYRESYLNKHKRKQMNVVASSKIRELARLKFVLQKNTTKTNLIDCIQPEMYEQIVAASKIISGYAAEKKILKAS